MLRRPTATLHAALVAALAATAPALAHDFWLEPLTLRVAPGAPVAVRLRVGERFQGDPVGRRSDRIERFEIIGSGTAAPLVAPDGADPAGLGEMPAGAGHAVAVYVGRPSIVELPAGRFEAYLREEGLEHVIETRGRLGETRTSGREAYSRCAKALLSREGSDIGVDAAAGCPFELVIAAPPPRGSGGTLAVTTLYRGAPAAGVRVGLIHEAGGAEKTAARSGPTGRVDFELDRPGRWLVRAVYMERAEAGRPFEWRSFWASVVLEVPGNEEKR